MQALCITKPGGPDVLAICAVPTPEPKRDELLVRVRVAGLNRADTLQRRGHYPPPPGYPEDIPGLEYAGDVVAAGTDVRRFRAGQRVFGLTGGGAQAEYLT
ncbi:MAG: alcohol dehydrogenase catalytic domain-containing protein, partial [Candidatus Eremiobacteraeota bacterium]|nr:alcohol dehydrogenase catalytic domain-containing protein [Candidatus Eremiobacteraeota bacterium]